MPRLFRRKVEQNLGLLDWFDFGEKNDSIMAFKFNISQNILMKHKKLKNLQQHFLLTFQKYFIKIIYIYYNALKKRCLHFFTSKPENAFVRLSLAV